MFINVCVVAWLVLFLSAGIKISIACKVLWASKEISMKSSCKR